MATYTTNGLRKSLGPLTTVFTPLPSCSVALVQCPETCTIAWRAQGCSDNTVFDTTDCWPEAAPGLPTPTPPFNGRGFYSPGLECPSGYSSACSATGGGSSNWPVEYSLLQSETAVGCCPNGFNCAWANGQTCLSVANNYATVAVATCSRGASVSASDLVMPYTITGLASSASYNGAVIGQYQVLAPLIDIRWQSSDRTGSSSDAASPAAGTQTGLGGDALRSSGNSGLSTGAKAAIGVAIPVVLIAMMAGAFFLWRKRRKTKTAPSRGIELPPNERPKPELQGNPVYELEEPPFREIGNKETPWHERHEMHGSDPQLPHLPG